MEAKETLAIWTDGGARGNPGPAGIGVRIAWLDPLTDKAATVLAELSESIGETTNNQAEYRALLLALDWLSEHFVNLSAVDNPPHLRFYTDSELLAYQIQGKYKVKNEQLRPLYDQALSQLKTYRHWKIIPIRREHNQVADRLVNQALDGLLTR